jgi:hypothetical protein
MAAVDPACLTIAYRDAMVAKALERMPGRVGVGIDGFAGRLLAGRPSPDDPDLGAAPTG